MGQTIPDAKHGQGYGETTWHERRQVSADLRRPHRRIAMPTLPGTIFKPPGSGSGRNSAEPPRGSGSFSLLTPKPPSPTGSHCSFQASTPPASMPQSPSGCSTHLDSLKAVWKNEHIPWHTRMTNHDMKVFMKDWLDIVSRYMPQCVK